MRHPKRSIRLLGLMAVLCLGTAGRAAAQHAGVIEGRVDAKGPVAVYLTGAGTAPEAGAQVAIRQLNKAFLPAHLSAPQGAELLLPNEDPVMHNVYSPSGVLGFKDMGVANRTKADQSNLLRQPLAETGIVHLACAIHPAMEGLVFVVPSRFHQVSEDGTYRFEQLPPGQYALWMMDREGHAHSLGPVEAF
ncbi:MAG: hypothetical protein R2834_12915 [Rhodothermales bacterium]